jgi:ERF superfamily
MMQSEQLNELAAALAKAQGMMSNAVMNRTNPHFKSRYADLASMLDAIRKPLSENGLAVAQLMEIREGGMVLRTVMVHTSGQWMASEYPLPTAVRPQEMGSAQTYARRYSLAALVCNSADEDDDAQGAEAGKQKIESKGRSPAKPAPNIMKESHDPETGEVPPSAAPAAPDGGGATTGAVGTLPFQEAAELAAKMGGYEQLNNLYRANTTTTEQKRWLTLNKLNLEKLYPQAAP